MLTSSCSGVSALKSPDDSLTASTILVSLALVLIRSLKKTVQAVEAVSFGLSKSAFVLKTLIFFFFSRTAFAAFCSTVRIFLFGFGLAFAFFFFFGLALLLGLALDLALGMALGAVFFGAGFFAALVAAVVGVRRAAAVVLPVWAFGRDTGLSA